jgi:hypothetical protein
LSQGRPHSGQKSIGISWQHQSGDGIAGRLFVACVGKFCRSMRHEDDSSGRPAGSLFDRRTVRRRARPIMRPHFCRGLWPGSMTRWQPRRMSEPLGKGDVRAGGSACWVGGCHGVLRGRASIGTAVAGAVRLRTCRIVALRWTESKSRRPIPFPAICRPFRSQAVVYGGSQAPPARSRGESLNTVHICMDLFKPA